MRTMKRRSLVRWREAFLPLAGLIAALAGRAEAVAALLGAYLLVRLCALCPDGTCLRAAADELDVQAVSRFRRAAGLMLLFGAALSAALAWYLVRPLRIMPDGHLWLYWCTGVAIVACRVCFSAMSLDRGRDSAALGEFLLALLLATAMLLGDAGWRFGATIDEAALSASPLWDAPALCAAAAFFVFLISVVVTGRGDSAARGESRRPMAKMFRRAPASVLRELLCPILLAALTYLSGPELLPSALAGWALYAVGSSLYRRSAAETPPLVAALVPLAAALMALIVLSPEAGPALLAETGLPAWLKPLGEAKLFGWPCAALPIALSAVLALAFNAHFGPLTAVCAALLLAQGLLPTTRGLAGLSGKHLSVCAGALACLCALPQLWEALRPLRARRTQRRLQR